MASARVRGLVVVLGILGLSGACGLAVAACASDEDPSLFVTMQERELIEGEWSLSGTGCMAVFFGDESFGTASSASGTAGAHAGFGDGGVAVRVPDPFEVAREVTPRGLRVVVTSGAQLLAIKLFSKEFLESGEIHRFEVTTPNGDRHELAHQGAHECVTDADLFAD